MPILAFSSLLRENKKNSGDKMLPPVGIEPGPLKGSDLTCAAWEIFKHSVHAPLNVWT